MQLSIDYAFNFVEMQNVVRPGVVGLFYTAAYDMTGL